MSDSLVKASEHLTKVAPWPIYVIVIVSKDYEIYWVALVIALIFALKSIFAAISSAAPEASKMVTSWRKAWKKISRSK